MERSPCWFLLNDPIDHCLPSILNQEMIVKYLIYISFIKHRSGHRMAIYITHMKHLISQSEIKKERVSQTTWTGSPGAQGTHFILGHKTRPLLSRSLLVFGVGVPLTAFTFLLEPQETTSCKAFPGSFWNVLCPQPERWHGHPEILGALPLSVGRFIKRLTF